MLLYNKYYAQAQLETQKETLQTGALKYGL